MRVAATLEPGTVMLDRRVHDSFRSLVDAVGDSIRCRGELMVTVPLRAPSPVGTVGDVGIVVIEVDRSPQAGGELEATALMSRPIEAWRPFATSRFGERVRSARSPATEP